MDCGLTGRNFVEVLWILFRREFFFVEGQLLGVLFRFLSDLSKNASTNGCDLKFPL